jgi:hypothetical protein
LEFFEFRSTLSFQLLYSTLCFERSTKILLKFRIVLYFSFQIFDFVLDAFDFNRNILLSGIRVGLVSSLGSLDSFLLGIFQIALPILLPYKIRGKEKGER